jgi:hypothetical protein
MSILALLLSRMFTLSLQSHRKYNLLNVTLLNPSASGVIFAVFVAAATMIHAIIWYLYCFFDSPQTFGMIFSTIYVCCLLVLLLATPYCLVYRNPQHIETPFLFPNTALLLLPLIHGVLILVPPLFANPPVGVDRMFETSFVVFSVCLFMISIRRALKAVEIFLKNNTDR